MDSTSFRALLLGDTTVTQLSGGRVYPLVLPEDAPQPAIVYGTVGGNGDQQLDGIGTRRLRMQIDCYASRYKDAESLRTAVCAVLDTAQGLQPDGSTLLLAEYLEPLDHFDSTPRDYRVGVEYRLHYNPPA